MKPILSLSTISFFLFAFITNLSLASLNNVASEQVLDIDGIPLVPGNQYYIFPASDNPQIGGLRLNQILNLDCSVAVLQNNAIKGLTVKFTIPGSSTGKILTNTNLDIEFTKKPNCAESSKWMIFYDIIPHEGCVGIGGPENYPGIRIIAGKFNIQKYGSGYIYKLGFCTDETGSCGSIALQKFSSAESGSRLVFIGIGTPYYFVFVDASYFGSRIINKSGLGNISNSTLLAI